MSILYNLSNITGFHILLYSPALGELDNNSKIYAINYITKTNQNYKIIKYNKELLSVDLIPEYGLFRSVIINCQNKVVGFSPPKSISYTTFIEKYPYSNKTTDIIAQEFIEGIMINVFWDPSIGVNGGWEISTRNAVGGNITFYKLNDSKTIHSMFLEACAKNNFYLHSLNPLFCYSFVLQHPDNKTIVPFKEVKLYLVELYEIMHVDEIVQVKSISLDLVMSNSIWNTSRIAFPQKYSFTSYHDLIERFGSLNTPYNVFGVMIKNMDTGERCKIHNPSYEQVNQLRTYHPKIQYQYFFLRKQGKMKEFLTNFPEYKDQFSKFREQLHAFTKTLFKNYILCFIRKKKSLQNVSKQYKHHLVKLHEKYRNELKANKCNVNNTIVIQYVNNLSPSQQMFSVNYHMRKRMIDFMLLDNPLE